MLGLEPSLHLVITTPVYYPQKFNWTARKFKVWPTGQLRCKTRQNFLTGQLRNDLRRKFFDRQIAPQNPVKIKSSDRSIMARNPANKNFRTGQLRRKTRLRKSPERSTAAWNPAEEKSPDRSTTARNSVEISPVIVSFSKTMLHRIQECYDWKSLENYCLKTNVWNLSENKT